jgi:hypothetical protein
MSQSALYMIDPKLDQPIPEVDAQFWNWDVFIPNAAPCMLGHPVRELGHPIPELSKRNCLTPTLSLIPTVQCHIGDKYISVPEQGVQFQNCAGAD